MKRIFSTIIIALCLTHTLAGQARKTTPLPSSNQPVQAEPASPVALPSEQNAPIPKEAADLFGKILLAEQRSTLYALTQDKQYINAADDVAELYSQLITRYPQLVPLLIGQGLSTYYNLKEGAKGAVQVSQAADETGIKFQLIIMAQNQRIIQLLEQIAKKR